MEPHSQVAMSALDYIYDRVKLPANLDEMISSPAGQQVRAALRGTTISTPTRFSLDETKYGLIDWKTTCASYFALHALAYSVHYPNLASALCVETVGSQCFFL
jgi:hypothetical protein